MSLLVIPNTFVNGTPSDAVLVNNNFNAVAAAVNNINSANIGVLGTYASQIVPTNTLQATFGGTQGFVFGGVTTSGQVALSVIGGAGANAFIVGSGTTSPVLGVDVTGNTFVQGNVHLVVSNAGSLSIPGVAGGGDIIAQNSVSSGRLLLGGATTAGALDFGSTAAGTWNFSAAPVRVNMGASQSTPGLLINGAASISGDLLAVDLTSGGTHAFRVKAAGDVSINGGVTTGIAGQFGIALNASSAAMLFGSTGTTAGILDFGSTTANVFSFQKNLSALAYVALNASAFNISSDAQFKTGIVPSPHGLAAILALKPSRYTLIADGTTDIGFVAQDVQAVIPEAVRTDGNGMLGLNYNSIHTTTVMALQDFYAEFKAYTAAHP